MRRRSDARAFAGWGFAARRRGAQTKPFGVGPFAAGPVRPTSSQMAGEAVGQATGGRILGARRAAPGTVTEDAGLAGGLPARCGPE